MKELKLPGIAKKTPIVSNLRNDIHDLYTFGEVAKTLDNSWISEWSILRNWISMK
jgi:hypothetical protein